jgi:hypothetical protein
MPPGLSGPRLPTEREEAAFDWLRSLGTSKVPYTHRTLFDHLSGTWRLLFKHGEREEVCLAGLYHSIYGTNIFPHKTLRWDFHEDKEQVKAVIGAEAELRVRLFCLARGRPRSILDGSVREQWVSTPADGVLLRDLRVIELANLMEQGGFGAIALAL